MSFTKSFDEYYYKYLNILPHFKTSSIAITKSPQRDKAINNWYFQPMIATTKYNNMIISIAPSLYEDFRNYTKDKTLTIDKLKDSITPFFTEKFEDPKIRDMYRMTLTSDINIIKSTKVLKLTKPILMSCLSYESEEKKLEIWNRKKHEILDGREYVILDNNKIISFCKVSNIDFNGGNLTVFTDEKYRNNGYGKLVTTEAINWCIKNNILPIYFVDRNNLPSIALAKSLGFNIMSKEIVVSTTCK